MSKNDPQSQKGKQRRWVLTVFFSTILISGSISLASDAVMENSNTFVAFLILLLIVFVGILFDIIGMAVATADEKPFHAMAARKVKGARECIVLLRNAERVSSVCNDVVGDICGVVSGSASATIAAQVLSRVEFGLPELVSLLMSSLVAALTVGGKAVGKSFAVRSCTDIVYHAGQAIAFLKSLGSVFRPKAKNKKR